MHDMMMTYDGDQKRYAKISGHGFRILAEAMEADLPYRLQCPALLICGGKDHAGSCIRYNKAWHERTGIPIRWLKNAGHDSNTDEPQSYVFGWRNHPLHISSQKEFLTRYAAAHGYTNLKILVDDGYTGTNFDRPGVQEGFALVKQGLVG